MDGLAVAQALLPGQRAGSASSNASVR